MKQNTECRNIIVGAVYIEPFQSKDGQSSSRRNCWHHDEMCYKESETLPASRDSRPFSNEEKYVPIFFEIILSFCARFESTKGPFNHLTAVGEEIWNWRMSFRGQRIIYLSFVCIALGETSKKNCIAFQLYPSRNDGGGPHSCERRFQTQESRDMAPHLAHFTRVAPSQKAYYFARRTAAVWNFKSRKATWNFSWLENYSMPVTMKIVYLN